jgi:isoaspartyl peptidase/L-asparaginase-like protein (Ntn-hydrolase superfamily)
VSQTPLVVLHGGAGPRRNTDYEREIQHMRECIEAARERLFAGASAVDIVVETVGRLESSGLYVAGRGASPNGVGTYELDASIMDGSTQQAGAVAVLEGFQSPIRVARSVMEQTPHVLLAGAGAASFAAAQGHARIDDASSWFTQVGSGELYIGEQPRGTVGCVARDTTGALAAATSTAGVLGKKQGRVGDTPIIGAGTWADSRVAVSCTGIGEYFLRTAAASQVANRLRFGGQDVGHATQAVLDEIGELGGEGGMIAVTADGHIAMRFAAERMLRAALHADGSITSEVFS